MEARSLRELCHDVAAPAAAIRLLADRVAAESPAGSRHHETLQQIACEAARIAAVCESVLDAPLGPSATRLDEVAAEAAASARLRYPGRIEVVAAEMATAAISPVVAWRILANLVDNACRAAGPQGVVRVLVTKAGSQARLSVTDSGPGFGHAATGRAGLGLEIVAGLVDQAGGELEVGATDRGGAAVTITLASAPGPTSSGAHDAGGIGVVICDPHQAFADALAALLTSAGWHVLGSSRDLGEAAAICSVADARACVTEILPPFLAHGQPLADALGTAPRTAFAALTASNDPAALRHALAAGVRGLALKSDDLGEIWRVLERCVFSRDSAWSGPVEMTAAARDLLRSTEPSCGDRSATGPLDLGTAAALTPREREALDCLVRGESTEKIAATMGVRVGTARGYLDSMLTKLGAHSRIEAVAVAVRAGLVDIPAQRAPFPGQETRVAAWGVR